MFKKLLIAAAFFASFSIQANACIITGSTSYGSESVFIDLKMAQAISIADSNTIRIYLDSRILTVKVDSAPMAVSVFARCKETK